MKKIAVIGSINTDLVTTVDRFLVPGETRAGKTFFTAFGGKGANQAVALAKLGADVSMLGKVGCDTFGEKYIQNFKDVGVKTDYIKKDGDTTGIAVITVEDSGANEIIIIAGANGLVGKNFIDEFKNIFDNIDIALFQFEIPLEANIHALALAKEKNITTILDPAPAVNLPNEIYQYVDYITPNETEAEILTGVKVDNIQSVKKAGLVLKKNGVKNVIIKAGKRGAYYIDEESIYFAPSYDVKTVDTTAAGDSFNAGLAYAVSLEKSIEEVLLTGCAVASLSTTGMGAQGAMPTYKETVILMESQKDIKIEKM